MSLLFTNMVDKCFSFENNVGKYYLFYKSALFVYPRANNTIRFHLYFSVFLYDLSTLQKKKNNSYHGVIPNLQILGLNHIRHCLITTFLVVRSFNYFFFFFSLLLFHFHTVYTTPQN